MRPSLVGTLLLLAALGTACASTAESGGVQRSSDVISAEEIATIQVSTAYEIVQRLRPQFLRARGTTTVRNAGPEGRPTGGPAQTGTELVVYVDNVRLGGVEVLHNIAALRVRDIRYVSASDATTKYGSGHTGGALEVRTRQQ